MLFASFLRWWYGPGWLDQITLIRERLDRSADFFSLELSLRNLFTPFRQIDADGVRKGSLDVILRAAFDQLFSRVFGAIVRMFLIIIGSIVLAGEAVIAALRLALWPAVPVLPVVGILLTLSGWVPWQ